LPEHAAYFDARESFLVADAVLATVSESERGYENRESVWEAFIRWRGEGDADYLRRFRANGKYIFYGVLQDLYAFAAQECGEGAVYASGQHLSTNLIERHIPDLLQATLMPTGPLPEQVFWLIRQFVSGATREIYDLEIDPRAPSDAIQLAIRYRSPEDMADYLRRAGHNPEVAFRRSFEVTRGALLSLLLRTIYGFDEGQLESELRDMEGRFRIALRPANRLHYEQLIDILLDYVRRLRERGEQPGETPPAEADLLASQAMQDVWAHIRKAGASDEIVLLRGESGTGKSYYARIIHQISERGDGPYVEVGLTADVGSDNFIQSNLFGHVQGAFTGAVDEKQGLFALADGGTIFLDEVGDASPELQAKLLRVLENKRFRMLGGTADLTVDVRIIAATNRDLEEMVREGRFREDLYYRLNVIPILLPPLRHRREDLPLMVEKIFEKVVAETGATQKHLAEDAFALLCEYSWPGNVRELENALRRAVALSEGDTVGRGDLPEAVRRSAAGLGGREGAHAVVGRVLDSEALRGAVRCGPRLAEAPTHAWPGHVDYARREYMKVLIEVHNGDLARIAEHWDRSSENTIRKIIRQFDLEEYLQAARKRG
jgi:transcriptional regulator with GAF, ATPase, and Fis domain